MPDHAPGVGSENFFAPKPRRISRRSVKMSSCSPQRAAATGPRYGIGASVVAKSSRICHRASLGRGMLGAKTS